MTNDWKSAADEAVRLCLDAPTGNECRLIMREVPQQAWSSFARAFKLGLQVQGQSGGRDASSSRSATEPAPEPDFTAQRSVVQGILLRQDKERAFQVEQRRRGAWPVVSAAGARTS